MKQNKTAKLREILNLIKSEIIDIYMDQFDNINEGAMEGRELETYEYFKRATLILEALVDEANSIVNEIEDAHNN